MEFAHRKPRHVLTINREGSFYVFYRQRTENQCGKEGQTTYKYFCSISASSLALTPEGYVMENLWTDQYFQDLYVNKGSPVPSCEQIAMDAVDHFRNLFKTHSDLKKVAVNRIYVRIHGTDVSFIECEWKKKV